MTQKRPTPPVWRRRVGAQLVRYRGDMPAGDAARMMNWPGPRLSRIERGVYRVTADEVRTLCAKYGIDDPDGVDEVARVAEERAGDGWWAAYADRIGKEYYDFIQLEAKAKTMRIQHPVVIPGPLQSPGFVREMITRAPTTVSAERAEMLVHVRLARQEILTRDEEPVAVHALVPESAFHARFESGPSIMRDQLQRLLDLSERPHVTLQIVPLTAHPTFGANGAMTILTFRHPWTPVASVDNPMGGSHTEDPDKVAVLTAEFDAIAAIALPVQESRDLLTTYLEGLHQK
ncbi:helix-turn-helix domain-containing protein [Streptomyces sp. NPDC001118]|uniref:helix-turn-helix domain-containing protein n=1 Tax=Streptomyces sp. bgisy154 TaxID=3413794 RepID=UPI003D74EA48